MKSFEEGVSGAGQGTLIENVLGAVREIRDPKAQIERLEQIQAALGAEKGRIAAAIVGDEKAKANDALLNGLPINNVSEIERLSTLAAEHAISSNDIIVQ